MQARFPPATFSGRFRAVLLRKTPFAAITPYVRAHAISFKPAAYAEQVLGVPASSRSIIRWRRPLRLRNAHRPRASQRQILRGAGTASFTFARPCRLGARLNNDAR